MRFIVNCIRITSITIGISILSACNGPFWYFPGGALQGPEQPFDAQRMPTTDIVMQLESNPSEPYSVNVGARAVDGSLYLDPTESRGWYQHIAADPNVRFRIDGDNRIYTAQAVRVTDPALLSRFEADRIVLQLAGRPDAS